MCKVSIQLKLNCRSSLQHKITSTLYTDGHTNTQTDRQDDSSIPIQKCVLKFQGTDNTNFEQLYCFKYSPYQSSSTEITSSCVRLALLLSCPSSLKYLLSLGKWHCTPESSNTISKFTAITL